MSVVKYISKDKTSLIIIIIVGFFAKLFFLDVGIGDYEVFLKPWVEFIKNNGYAHALKHDFYNYPPSYMYYLVFLAKTGVNSLYAIKFLSIGFDYILSLYIGKIILLKSERKNIILLSLATIPLIPTIFVNSAYLSQCDSIYATFAVIALYYSLKEKFLVSILFLGIAFAFKLQTIFILPYFFVLMLRGKIPFYCFFIIPAIYFISILPAWCFGRPLKELLNIYFFQSTQDQALTLSFPNVYIWLKKGGVGLIKQIGIASTFILTLIAGILLSKKKYHFDFENCIKLAFLSSIIIPFVLPSMHERYMYLGDVLSVLYFLVLGKNILFPIGIVFVSLYSYVRSPVRFHDLLIMEPIFFIYLIIIIFALIDFVKTLEKNSVNTYIQTQ